MPRTGPSLTLALAIVVLAPPAGGASTAQPALAAYRSCSVIHNHGAPYRVAARRMSCERARGAAHFVLNRRRAPRHWACRLRRLSRGTASCRRRSARFVVWASRKP